MTRYCEWCGQRFQPKWDQQRFCDNRCTIDHLEFEEQCDELEAVERLQVDGDISGFWDEESDDTQLIRELVGDGYDYDEIGGEG